MLKKNIANDFKLEAFKNCLRITLGVLTLIIVSCNLIKEKKVTDPELMHVLAISDCDSLRVDKIFQKHSTIKWPEVKPKSVVEAVLKLDSMTNDYTKHLFKICDPIEFHLDFGMGIRNEWIHNGEDELNEQLFKKLKLGHFDYSSGLILGLFGEYLKEGEVNLMEQLGDGIKADSMQTVRTEYQNIEDDLNKIKEENGG